MKQKKRAVSVRSLLPSSRPLWVLALSTLARSTGNGVVVAIIVLYLTRSVEISSTSVGLALAIAAVVGMIVSIPAGHASDVLGARPTAICSVVLQGVAVWGYVLVGGFGALVAAAALVAVTDSASSASRGALVALAVPQKERVRTRAYLRSVTNVGFSVGALLGGLVLNADSPAAYTGALIASGALFVVAGLAFLALDTVPQVPRPAEESPWGVLRDGPFVAVGMINAVLMMNAGILDVALPIWIAENTQAPMSVFAPLLLINTVMVVFLQVPVSKGAEDVRGGARALFRSGLWLAACCAAIALASGRSTWVAVVLLVAGVAIHTVGELLYSAGSWALSYELAPEHAQGQYQGMFGLTTQLGTAITPAVTALLIVQHGWIGWLVMGAMLAAAGLAAPAVARWAERSRPAYSRPAAALAG
ncbi:MFS transporter [Streptomyces bambusae]|uniref:MFS transporter n=1 Tax=Streptomyces bambusae TaxID=1550616 RepID=UPI001CFE2169|nr:MFS transporter [Streptomyces bambusae]MCB5167436.1 MFS transporter [Streptomyces bambusae]